MKWKMCVLFKTTDDVMNGVISRGACYIFVMQKIEHEISTHWM